MARTKKVKASGRYKVGYGKRVRERLNAVEKKQRKKQACPFCKKKTIRRISMGIFYCRNCEKKFTSSAYYVE